VIDLSAKRLADAVGARLVAGDPGAGGPARVKIDSRDVGPGDLFFGIPGERADGGAFARAALEAGAWGVLVAPPHADALSTDTAQVVIEGADPVRALGVVAREWRRELGCDVVGVTGSTGKTSTKDILAALLAPHRVTHSNPENLNTEIGLPLAILAAERDTQVMVLEMAMRGEGQIAELVEIAEPDVGVILNVGPVHLELLGSVDRVAAAKAELIRDLRPGATCVVPAEEPLLSPHLRADLETVTFGPGGDVSLMTLKDGHAVIEAKGERLELELPFAEAHNVLNTLAAVAAALALGVVPGGPLDLRLSALRGELVALPRSVTVINDCYNANPMSMRAALDNLAARDATRRIAVLGVMAELGEDGRAFHEELGRHADELGVDVLVTVGADALAYRDGFGGEAHAVATPEEAAAVLDELLQPGDLVLVKGSRSAGLEAVLAGLEGAEPQTSETVG
jgi:UDP-N-acetylmuramoyl-tripeptide--D-alanyl-D-alanine ligase